jgi:hypothetical protein
MEVKKEREGDDRQSVPVFLADIVIPYGLFLLLLSSLSFSLHLFLSPSVILTLPSLLGASDAKPDLEQELAKFSEELKETEKLQMPEGVEPLEDLDEDEIEREAIELIEDQK